MIQTILHMYLKRGFMALNDAPNHKQSSCAVLHPTILPVSTMQHSTIHVQTQVVSRDADGNMVPVSIRETKEWDPAHRHQAIS